MQRLSVAQHLLHPYKGHGFFIYIGRLLSKTIMFFCFNNKLNKRNKSDCWNQWTLAFTEWNEFGKGVQHVDVDRFVSFAERLRSLSCLVDSFHLFHSLLNNIVLKWKSRDLKRMCRVNNRKYHHDYARLWCVMPIFVRKPTTKHGKQRIKQG